MKTIYVSLSKNIRAPYPCAKIDLLKWLFADSSFRDQVDYIRSCTDPNKIRTLKEQMPSITVSGIFTGRKANTLQEHSGIICIDIDAKDNPGISTTAMKEIVAKLNSVLYAGLSVSGKGICVYIRILDPTKHKLHFNALEVEFKELGLKIDKSCSDVSRLRIYSYDDDAFVNFNACKYNKFLESDPNTNEQVSLTIPTLTDGCLKDSFTDGSITFFPTCSGENYHIHKVDKVKLKSLIEYVVSKQIDITAKYKDWFIICFTIAYTFGENGRELFHEISKFYPRYSVKESNREFNKAFVYSDYKFTQKNIFQIANEYLNEISF